MNLKTIKLFYIALALIVSSLVFCDILLADYRKKVLIFPFNIHTKSDLSYLRSGIVDMLSTRLSHNNKLELISYKETDPEIKNMHKSLNEKLAVLIARRFKADYVLLGSITLIGNSVSTDARFIDVVRKKPLIIFSQLGKSHGDVILHINYFANQINEKVFGMKAQPELFFQKKNNDSALQKRQDNFSKHKKTQQGSLSNIHKRDGNIFSSVWKSKKFNEKITGISVGDVDNDGRNEIVFISKNKIFIYRYQDGKLKKVKEIKYKGSNRFIWLDVADINKNGKAEIFITNISQTRQRLKSFVVEWNGKKFNKIVDKTNFYYKISNVHGKKDTLLAQKMGINKIFVPGIFELVWSSGKYVAKNDFILPEKINIYDFAYGDVFNNNQEMIIRFTKNDKISILNKKGDEQWTSSNHYGGNTTYIQMPADLSITENRSGDQHEIKQIYLPQRIYVTDFDKDGNNEIIVSRNQGKTGRYFMRIRSFSSGHIEALAWNELGLNMKVKSQNVSKYISDFVVADADNDRQDEIVFSFIAEKKKSFIAFGKF